ncbi:glycoside hydrolase family 5 protein [Lanmaoa asiatica]|nr:glycoside hydrolase family 5 protein [Lanmaoa asiatica]
MAFKSLSVLAFAAVPVNAQTFQPLRFAGVNIPGFDFGCGTDGTCNITQACPPLIQLGCADGLGQMQHFVENDGYNVFRLPVGWQYLTYNKTTGVLNETQFSNYNILVDACLSTGAYCGIDVCPQLRTNIMTWAGSVQAAVTAIHSTGASSQIILLPGNNYTSAETFISSGSAAALNMVRNPDGSITNLVMDVHKYLDYDNSGTHAQCATNNIESSWYPLSTWLRKHDRQALNTETGGGNVDSCVGYLSQQIGYQAANSDVILGYVGWAAGSLMTDYILSETPYYNGTGWNDTLTVSMALSPMTNMLVASVV